MNIYEFAMEMEKDGEKYYRELAQKTNDPGMRSILQMLADDEVKHYNAIQEMMQGQDTGFADTEILKNSKNVFAQMEAADANITLDSNQVDLYREARDIEQKSVDYYLEKSEKADQESHRTLFARLANEEKKHYRLLDNIIELLMRPQEWIENAEFNHLEEY